MKHKIFPISDSALTVEFGNEISIEKNNLVQNLARFLDKKPFRGLIEIVPAYSSLSCFYDIKIVRQTFPAFPTAFDAVRNLIGKALEKLEDVSEIEPKLLKIPVSFAHKHALDLDFVARANELSTDQVIKTFLARIYRVYMLGFLPGFAYMGEVDERIATARKTSPRQKVPKGSVGIAGRQTGVYSLESPGGWQIIGATNLETFVPNAEKPTILQAGDSVQFYKADF